MARTRYLPVVGQMFQDFQEARAFAANLQTSRPDCRVSIVRRPVRALGYTFSVLVVVAQKRYRA